MSWPTGDAPLAARFAVRFLVPQNDWIVRALIGADNWLQYFSSWDQVGSTTPDQIALIFAQTLRDVRVEMTSVGQIVCFPADNMQYINRNPADGASQWLKCDGASISQIAYPDLFAVIGTTFGGGGGVFTLPDIRGRVIVDAGTGSGLTPRALAAVFGEETHTLTTPEIPSHDHTYSSTLTLLTGTPPPLDASAPNPFPSVTGATGGDGAHNNVQPSIALFYYIQAFP